MKKNNTDKLTNALLYTIRILFWVAFAFSLFIKCFYLQFTTQINTRPFMGPVNNNMMAAIAGSILVILASIMLVSNKRRFIVLLITDIFFSLLLFADTIYFRYYNNVLTIPVFYQIGLVGDTVESISALLKIKDLVFIADLPFLFAGILIMRKLKKGKTLKLKKAVKFASAAIFLAAGLLVVSGSYRKADTSLFLYDHNHVIRRLGILYFHCYDTSNFVKENFFENKTLTAEEINSLNEFFANNETPDNNLTGTQKGKNLIVVQLEAIQNFLINAKVGGREITPHLNELARNSLYFDNLYYQIAGGNTSDAEFLCNISLYPADKGAAYFRFPSNVYFSLPGYLKDEGYNCFSFHANEASFWNRHTMYSSIGFDKFYSDKDFTLDEKLGWGLSDMSFLQQSVEKLKNQQPFYGFLITLSSHHPYGAFADYDFDVEQYEGTLLGNYMKAANYVDKAVGHLLQLLKENGLYENTVLVIYGDHFGINRENSHLITAFLGKDDNTYEYMELQKVPLIIHSPGIEAKTISTTAGQIDIMPTVLNLYGIKTPYAMGRDILSTDYGYALLRNGTVITDKYIFINSSGEIYDKKTGEKLDINEYGEEIQSIQKYLDLSDLILKKNALKKLKK